MLVLWCRVLEPYTPEQCDAALGEHIKRCAYLPDLHEILAYLPPPPERDPMTDWERRSWERRSWERLTAWHEAHEKALHAEGRLTAVECKGRGLTFADYCAQFEMAVSDTLVILDEEAIT